MVGQEWPLTMVRCCLGILYADRTVSSVVLSGGIPAADPPGHLWGLDRSLETSTHSMRRWPRSSGRCSGVQSGSNTGHGQKPNTCCCCERLADSHASGRSALRWHRGESKQTRQCLPLQWQRRVKAEHASIDPMCLLSDTGPEACRALFDPLAVAVTLELP